MAGDSDSKVVELRDALAKALLSKSESEMIDILKVCHSITMNIDLLRKTKIGSCIQEIKADYAGKPVCSEAKKVSSKWRKDCDTSSSSASAPQAKDASATTATVPPLKKACSSSGAGKSEDDKYIDGLDPMRKKIILLLAACFKDDCAESTCKTVSISIESAINGDLGEDMKQYIEKSKSLTINLKANATLRKSIVDGSLEAGALVHMTPSELADADIQKSRDDEAAVNKNAKRGDLYEIIRGEILEDNGIDANKGGEFTCEKCKGSKTTHSAQQLRSSDEPMTVFITCLTCGNRWTD